MEKENTAAGEGKKEGKIEREKIFTHSRKNLAQFRRSRSLTSGITKPVSKEIKPWLGERGRERKKREERERERKREKERRKESIDDRHLFLELL